MVCFISILLTTIIYFARYMYKLCICIYSIPQILYDLILSTSINFSLDILSLLYIFIPLFKLPSKSGKILRMNNINYQSTKHTSSNTHTHTLYSKNSYFHIFLLVIFLRWLLGFILMVGSPVLLIVFSCAIKKQRLLSPTQLCNDFK